MKIITGQRRLTPTEIAEKKRLGLCYKCDVRWFKTHECSQMELQVITVIDGVEVEMNNEDWIDTFEDENGVVTELLEMSFSYNFLDPYVATKLNLAPQQGANLDIILGTGIAVRSAGVCHQVPFTLQQVNDVADFIMLELGKVDMVLGIQWLRTLGKCVMDWETHEMSFIFKGQRVTLNSDASLIQGGVHAQMTEYVEPFETFYREVELITVNTIEL